MKIAFFSHSFPPIIGGIERQNFEIYQMLSLTNKVELVANTKGKKKLFFFFFLILWKLPILIKKNNFFIFGSAVLAPFGFLIKLINSSKKVIVISHGLDITFVDKKTILSKIYEKINISSLKKVDKIIAVSNYTKNLILERKINKNVVFIPNGFNYDNIFDQSIKKDQLKSFLPDSILSKKIILRVGRFVAHKGTHWFIEKVLPFLRDDFVFIACGGHKTTNNKIGDEDIFFECQKIIKYNNLENKVFLLPNIEFSKLKILFNTCYLYVSPNIPIKGSMEGFGINAIEASGCGKIVLASKLEGLTDAIINRKNGFLIEPMKSNEWIETINNIEEYVGQNIPNFEKKAQKYTIENFSWAVISGIYQREIENA